MRDQRHAPAALYPLERPGTQCTGGWAGPPGPVWTGAENLAPIGIRSPDRPARSQSVYRLGYPAQHFYIVINEQCTVIPRLTSDPANEFFG